MFNRLVITTIRWQKPVRPKVTSSNRFFCPTNNKTLHLPSEITKEKPQILKFKKMDELINESTDHRRCNCDVCVLMCFREMSVVYCTFSCWMMHYNLFRSHRVKPANISRFHYANRPPLLHSRQSVYVCVCVCVCVCDYTCVAPVTPPPQQQYISSILITPSLAFTGLTEFVHVSPTPVCDLLPCYTTWQIHECCCDSLIASNRHKNTSMVAHTHTHTQTHTNTLLDTTESLGL